MVKGGTKAAELFALTGLGALVIFVFFMLVIQHHVIGIDDTQAKRAVGAFCYSAGTQRGILVQKLRDANDFYEISQPDFLKALKKLPPKECING